jgi:hypothetical protein
MPITIEVNLRVPDVNIRSAAAPATRIVNAETRFCRMIDVEALPKVGDVLELVAGGDVFPVVVKRLDWADDKNRFIARCQYARKSMHVNEYQKLRTDPDWTSQPLLGD